jgi:hypothetical protein
MPVVILADERDRTTVTFLTLQVRNIADFKFDLVEGILFDSTTVSVPTSPLDVENTR